MDILGMDVLGWDCPAPNGNFAEKFGEHDPNTDDSRDDRRYDLMELNCCVVREAYRRGDVVLWGRVLAFWDALPAPDRYAA